MTIDEKTKVPLFIVMATIPVIIVSVLWIGTLSARVTTAEQRTDRIVDKIHAMEGKEDRILDGISDLRERLARIEERVTRRK